MKRSDLIKEDLRAAKENARKVLASGTSTIDEINATTLNIETLEAKLNLALKEEGEIQANLKGTVLDNKNISNGIDSQAYENAFVSFLKGNASLDEKMTIQAALSSTADADGGLLIPKDQETQVIELARDYSSLRDLVYVEPVSTLTGTRVIEVDGEYTPFAEVTEGSKISDIENGDFKAIPYSCKTYGGILPIPNNLLKDNKGNLLYHVSKWFAKKKVATENKLIGDSLSTFSKTAMKGIDDIKTVLNKTLDPAISANAIVVTNQTGFNELDKMKDTDGNYLLQPDPTKPTQKLLKGRPVKVYPDKVLANDTTKAPVIIGDFKRAITLFDRQLLTVDSTNIGAGAFETNSTKVRGLLRMDVQKFDEKAIVFLQYDTAPIE
ncbi:phage major capsid protein [Fusobacterium mortiferum]|uniref:Phage major capsid protein n=1 Tax=Fusobacterium mortiferum ATCC 9817 TaxID=469616 RepID=A0ABN5J8C5_FUSMR|nr:phage major capsid protein [Fusobacterium mortiferum]AVQ18762.1 phage major capsid protein [Fusobacterium mortiferum ATCC 9817]EEO34999.1 phage major capsid protein, HK97 family [Fusobacterium mortiferum ATCC 9817]